MDQPVLAKLNNILAEHTALQVILVPSLRDAHHDFVFPQPPFNKKKACEAFPDYAKVRSISSSFWNYQMDFVTDISIRNPACAHDVEPVHFLHQRCRVWNLVARHCRAAQFQRTPSVRHFVLVRHKASLLTLTCLVRGHHPVRNPVTRTDCCACASKLLTREGAGRCLSMAEVSAWHVVEQH
jgi:hypothetical protein